MSYTYAVLGGGRQGTAAAYDMAKFGDAKRVLIADIDLTAAEKSAARVNTLLGTEIAEARQVDASNRAEVLDFLKDVDSFLSAVPYWLNPAITDAAIEAKANMCDLGGNTDLVREQMKLDDSARDAGIAVVPDCGQVPGMGTSLIMYAMSLLDKTVDVFMWDGGNDQNPRPPFNYILTFNIAGLTNEYYGHAIFLRDYKIVEVPTFLEEDYEFVEFPEPIGAMEAFVAGGGTSTAPWTFEGKIRTYQNKTLRHIGHFVQWKTLIDMGFLEEEPIDVGGIKVSPREVLHTLIEPKIRATEDDRDFVIVRVKAVGEKDGRDAEALIDVIDYYDEETGFTAMERTTGFHGAIVAIMNARGVTPRGVNPVETAVPGPLFVDEMRKREIKMTETLTFSED
jgi:lysine 6-dehydrogenase